MLISDIARASLRSELLMDFDCYVDTDIGLIRLIKEKYLDERVFDRELINSNIIKIIKLLYNRKDKNPLYVFSKDGVSKEDLDDYYNEFIKEEYDEILARSVTTEIKSLINLFRTESGIHITFLCKNQEEIDLLKRDETLKNDKFVLKDSKNVDFSIYTAYYFKYLDEEINKYIYPYKTYYFSKYKINFNDDFSLVHKDIIDKIVYNRGEVEILDLYNMSLLEGD